jgi:hypothetical protein
MDAETVGIFCAIAFVLILILIRACVHTTWQQDPRPPTPPESLYR